MNVRDLMSHTPVTAPMDAPLTDVAKLMLEHRVGSVLVVDERGQLVGIVTESNFTGHKAGIAFSDVWGVTLLNEWLTVGSLSGIVQAARDVPVRDIMSRNVVTIGPDEPIEDAVRLLVQKDHTRLPVVENGRPLGVIARHDLLKAILLGLE